MVAGKLAMNQLIQLKKTDGYVLRVIDWITSLNDYECEDFAHMLLKNDSQVERHLTECGGDNNKFIRAVLEIGCPEMMMMMMMQLYHAHGVILLHV